MEQQISLAVDAVVFTIKNGQLQVLLVRRKNPPFEGRWALPGGFVKPDETLDTATKRELHEETNVIFGYLEQLYTFSKPDRDPRGRVVTCAYMGLVNQDHQPQPGSEIHETQFFPVDQLPYLAFDHYKILRYAMQRLKRKLEYTNVAQYVLPHTFKMGEIQKVYEVVFGKDFDVRNFRKKIQKVRLLQPTGEVEENVKHRPAKYYEFVDKGLKIMDVL